MIDPITLTPEILAHLHARYYVSDKHLFRRYTTKNKPITSGYGYAAIFIPTTPPTFTRLTFATIAYALHHTPAPPNDLHIVTPDDYAEYALHIPANTHVTHRNCNSADFSKANLVLKHK
jgi:hypothetical protein